MNNFGTTFKSLRQSRGLTQQEMAKHIGVSRSTVGMYESGEREPSFETLEKIADFFNVNMGILMGEPEAAETGSIIGSLSAYDPSALSELLTIYNSMDETTRRMWIEIGKTMVNKKENS